MTFQPPLPRSWRTLALHVALIIVLLTPTLVHAQTRLPAAPPLRDGRFGVVQTYDAPQAATAAGVGWTRVLFWWHQMQPTGKDDWNEFYFEDRVLKQELADGRELVGLLAGTPTWASDSGTVHAVPAGLYLPYNHPDNLWGQFVAKMATRYAGKIDRWIIWNEPDVWDDSHPGKQWDGSVQDYAQLLRVAYLAAKDANPNAQIHLTATTYWWDKEYGRDLYFTRLLGTLRAIPDAAVYGYFFDVASLHIYFKPEQVYDVTSLYRTMLDAQGFRNKPLWINETNAPPSRDPKHPAPGLSVDVTLEEQTYYMVQAWAMGIAAGAERLSFYKMRDEPALLPGVEPYGLVRKDGTLRPAFWTYRTLVTYLGNYDYATLTRRGYLRRVVVWRGDLGTTTVVWNIGLGAETMRIPANADSALLVDPMGPVQTITPTNGAYFLRLEPSRTSDIGGRPYLIVEGAGASILIPRYNNVPAPSTPTPTRPPTRTPLPTRVLPPER